MFPSITFVQYPGFRFGYVEESGVELIMGYCGWTENVWFGCGIEVGNTMIGDIGNPHVGSWSWF